MTSLDRPGTDRPSDRSGRPGVPAAIDQVDHPMYLYRPIFDGDVIDDLEIVHINAAARTRPLSQHLRVGDRASEMFVDVSLALDAAEVAWRVGTAPTYSIRRHGLLGDELVTVRFDVTTFRVDDQLAQSVVDLTIADRLALTEGRYRAVLDALSEGVALLTRPEDTTDSVDIVYENPASTAIEDLAVHDELQIVDRVRETGQTEIVEIGQTDTGSQRALRVAYHPLDDGVVRVIVDQTAERALLQLAERESHRQREVLDQVMEAVGIWTPVRDPSGRLIDLVVVWRNAAAERLGAGRIKLGDRLSDVLVDPGPRAGFLAMAEAVLTSGEPVEHQYRSPEDDSYPIQSSTGRIRFFAAQGELVVAVLDDSELADATSALTTTEARLRTTLDGVSDTVATWIPVRDETGAVVDFTLSYGNPAMTAAIPLGTRLSHIGADVDLIALALRALEIPGPHTVTTSFDDGGQVRTWQLTAVAVGDEVVGTGVDLTELVARNAELGWLAAHDPVSQLLNRNGLLDQLGTMVETERRTLALLWIEASELDMIRHTFGFATADLVVEAVAARLEQLAAETGAIAARPEDGAFAVILPMTETATAIIQRAAVIIESLTRPIDVDGLSLLVGPHGGVVIAPLNGHDPGVVTKRAKTAAAEARRTGSTLVRWRQEIGADQRARASLLGEFERGLRLGQVSMSYQPTFCARTGAFTGAEALARWHHPERGLIPPSLFVPSVEATALIRPFSRWAIETALSSWQALAELAPDSRVAVNLPVPLIADAAFADLVVDTFLRTGLHPRQLQVEITERGLSTPIQELVAGLSMLTELGVEIALDDFGAGQSSLAFLRDLPLHEVKIDQGFVRNLDFDPTNQAIVRGCVGIARSVGLQVCAEGVETVEEADAARELGCDLLQGHLYGRPMSMERLIALVSDHQT
jgi:EAL domain-containing protein (putative c-di-GMP-specific phosphodiesterase class I)/GGDEF domain-containing protein